MLEGWLMLALGQELVGAHDLRLSEVQALMKQETSSSTFKAFKKKYELKKSSKYYYSSHGPTEGVCLRSIDAVNLVVVRFAGQQTHCDAGRFMRGVKGLPGLKDDRIDGYTTVGELVDAWGLPLTLRKERVGWALGDMMVVVEPEGDLDRSAKVRALEFVQTHASGYDERIFFSKNPGYAELSQPRHEAREGLWNEGQGRSQTKPAPRPVASKPRPAPTPRPTPKPRPVAPAAPTLASIDAPVRTGTRRPDDAAVVVGLEAYPFLGNDVPYATRDAEAFRDLLVYTRGVPPSRVQVLTSGGREQILAAVDRAAEEGKDGTVWLYFAGHGAAHPDTGERLLLGDDVRPMVTSFSSRGAGVDEVAERLTQHGATAQLVLDACYTGASRSGASIAGGTRFVVPTYAVEATEAVAQWNAAGPDQLSHPLDEARHGAFTYYAIGALRGWADGELDGKRDGIVRSDEAQAYVYRMMRTAGIVEQAPVWVGDDTVLTEGSLEAAP